MSNGLTASIVLTTINIPVLLEGYLGNLTHYGHLDKVQVFVIPDLKTPAETYNLCKSLSSGGMKVQCPDLEEQESFLKRVGFPPQLISYNSDNRRNIGYLMALESGSDFIISIDDDNYCRKEEDFFSEHAVVCQKNIEMPIVDTDTGWYNLCDLLELDRAGTTYARGFPYYARHKNEKVKISKKMVDVHMNAGLWLLDPDVDAITWLVAPAHSKSFKGTSFVLGDRGWSPINTQNTAVRRDAIASYYYLKMGYPLTGIMIDRYGDIFSGYFAQACARHLGGAIRVGTPIAEHKRNNHNYLKDANNEWACILVLEDLLVWLTKEVKLEGVSYVDSYISLSYAIEDVVENFRGNIWSDASRGYFHQMAYYMRQWATICKLFL